MGTTIYEDTCSIEDTPLNQITIERRQRKLRIRSPTYRKSRKVYRGIALTLWMGTAIVAFYHQQTSTELSSRSRRSTSELTPEEQEIQENLTPEEKLVINYKKWKSNCIPEDDDYIANYQADADKPKASKHPSVKKWDDFYDSHQNQFSEKGYTSACRTQWTDIMAKEKVESNPQAYAQVAVLCCLGKQYKKSHHNGPIDEFPSLQSIMSLKDVKKGGFLLNLLFSLYMFAALAIVCDDYFVPALERLSEELQLSEDVAGATFMAAGSSAPELFTSVIGVFVAKSDIGIGTIVGSAVFNILVIIGACGLLVKGDIHLSWWPLFRDSSFYLVTIITLLTVIYPDFDYSSCAQWSPVDSTQPADTCANPRANLIKDKVAYLEKCNCDTFDDLSSFDLLFGENQRYAKSEVHILEAVVMLIIYSIYISIMKFNAELESKFTKLLGMEAEPEECVDN